MEVKRALEEDLTKGNPELGLAPNKPTLPMDLKGLHSLILFQEALLHSMGGHGPCARHERV